jgi:integrase
MKIQRVADRSKLPRRREPYWHRVRKGCFLGFRKTGQGGVGHWIARYRDAATGRQQHSALGDFGDLPDSDRFDAAMTAAEEWFRHLDKGGSPQIADVRTACMRYADHIAHVRGERAATDIRRRLKQYVFNDSTFSGIELGKLTPIHIDGWRKRLAATPSRSGRTRGELRSASSLNRDMTCLRAALNLAAVDGLVSSDFAWRAKLRPSPNADRPREILLSLDQRKGLIANLPADLANFVMAACLLPLRPGALASLTVGNLDVQRRVLTIGKDKSGAGRKIAIPPRAFSHLVESCKGKLPGACIFTQANGQPWTRHQWKKPFKQAATALGLPEQSVFYSLRHSLITELVHSGVDLLTVAQISGTSLKMIERHYGHLTEKQSLKALEHVAV